MYHVTLLPRFLSSKSSEAASHFSRMKIVDVARRVHTVTETTIPGSIDALAAKAELAELVVAHGDLFRSATSTSSAHKQLIEIFHQLQSLTPGCATPALILSDDPWLNDPNSHSETTDEQLAQWHRQSMSFDSIRHTLLAIECVGKNAEFELSEEE
jgi:hypothetical protein